MERGTFTRRKTQGGQKGFNATLTILGIILVYPPPLGLPFSGPLLKKSPLALEYPPILAAPSSFSYLSQSSSRQRQATGGLGDRIVKFQQNGLVPIRVGGGPDFGEELAGSVGG